MRIQNVFVPLTPQLIRLRSLKENYIEICLFGVLRLYRISRYLKASNTRMVAFFDYRL